MSLLYKNRIEIPDSLSRNIRAICLDSVGEYDQGSHAFVCPRCKPSQGSYEEIQELMKLHEIDLNEVKGITKLVLGATQADAKSRSVDAVKVLGPSALKVLTHLRIKERGATTDLLYLGEKKFFVVDTTRSTILLNDVLEARGQLDRGSAWEFSIYRNGCLFIDNAFLRVNTDAWFTTGDVQDIEIFDVPEICVIVDENEEKGGALKRKKVSYSALMKLIELIRTSLEEAGPTYFEDNQLFPNYNELLSYSKANGISTYVLNMIAQCVEKGEKHTYQFVRDDWHEHKTEKEKELERQREIQRKVQEHKNYEDAFYEKLETIKVKKVFFGLFEKDGAIADEAEMENLIKTLESHSKDEDLRGAVKVLTPRTDYDNALKKSRRNVKKNIINGSIIGAIVAVSIFVATTWALTKKGLSNFDEAIAPVQGLIEATQYEDATAILEDAYTYFSPSYMRFVVMSRHNKLLRTIELAKDEDVKAGIEQINTILKATRGRFDKRTEEMLFRLLQLRPENKELLELKEKWKRN